MPLFGIYVSALISPTAHLHKWKFARIIERDAFPLIFFSGLINITHVFNHAFLSLSRVIE